MEPIDIAIEARGNDAGVSLPPLLLRPPRTGDRDAVSQMYNDPETTRWSLTPAPFTPKHATEFCRAAGREWERDSPRWLITEVGNDRVLGTVALRRHPRRVWEVVYHTAPWARRSMVALRSVHAAANFAFTTLGAARLKWSAIVGNHLSRLIAIRLGFQLEGTERASADQRGNRVDQWVGALLPTELRDLDDPPPGYETDRARALMFAQPQPVLDTELPGLRLRALHGDDIDDIMASSRDKEMMRWTSVPRPYERKHAEFFVDSVGAANWREGAQAIYALADAEDRYCGSIDLRLNKPDLLTGEIGFGASPWARGKGYMTAAVRRICDFGFDSFGLQRVEWKAFVGNDASRRVAEKAGFTMEGTLRCDVIDQGQRVDSWLASIVRKDR